MPKGCRKIIAFVVVFVFYLVLIAGQILDKFKQLPDHIGEAFPHLSDLAAKVVAGIILLWVFEEALEDFIAPSIKDGLTEFAKLTAVNLKTQLEVPASVVFDFTTAVSDLIDQHVRTPEVRNALKAGRIAEAAQKATGEEEITVLLKSENSTDWDRAVELLNQMPDPNPQYFVTFSYLFWQAQLFQRAKEVAETGLNIAEAKNNPIYIAKLKNTLAYVYTELGEFETKARDFAATALANEPESPTRLDTMCFVVMKFARSEREVAEALSLNEKARAKGLPLQDYMQNVSLASRILEAIGKKGVKGEQQEGQQKDR